MISPTERFVPRPLGEALFKREWDENTAPMLSVLLPGTRAGGTTACRFDHPDQHSNGPMSSLSMRMHSLGLQPEMNGPNNWMIESKSRATVPQQGELACGREMPAMEKENATDSLIKSVRLATLAVVNGQRTVHHWNVGPLKVSLPSVEWQLQCPECTAQDCAAGQPGGV